MKIEIKTINKGGTPEYYAVCINGHEVEKHATKSRAFFAAYQIQDGYEMEQAKLKEKDQ